MKKSKWSSLTLSWLYYKTSQPWQKQNTVFLLTKYTPLSGCDQRSRELGVSIILNILEKIDMLWSDCYVSVWWWVSGRGVQWGLHANFCVRSIISQLCKLMEWLVTYWISQLFGRCHRSSAAVTPVKYWCDWKDLSHNSVKLCNHWSVGMDK